MFKESNMGLIRVQRRTAKRLFEEGKDIFITPHKMRFSEQWNPPCSITAGSESKFDDIVNNFVYYRCTTETGKYPSFYVKSETLN